VAILYRLDRFALDYDCSGSVTFVRVALPICIWLAVWDAWESRLLFESCFVTSKDVVHLFFNLVSWILLALMGVTLQTSDAFTWATNDATVFASLKFVHAFVRFVTYAECAVLAKSERTQKAAGPRCIAVGCTLPILLAAPFLAAYVSPEWAGLCWFLHYIIQRIVWFSMLRCSARLKADAFNVRINHPFIIRRLHEWIQIQIGASLLGLITSDAPLATGQAESQAMACVVFLYIFLGCLDLLCYAVSPHKPHDHALLAGGMREAVWLEIFSLQGIGLFGIGVGLRSVVALLQDTFDDDSFLWVLAGSAFLATLCVFVQELLHVGALRQAAGRKSWLLKATASLAYMVLPSLAIYAGTGRSVVLFSLGLAIIAGFLVLLHIAVGGMKREIARLSYVKLNGHLMAAVLARKWLHRARTRIREDCRLPVKTVRRLRMTPSQVEVVMDAPVSPSRGLQQVARYLSDVDEAPTSSEAEVAEQIEHDVQDAPPRAELTATPTGEHDGSAVASMRILTKVINARFYAPPEFVVIGDVFSELNADWADLFMDVVFIGVIFRVGDFFLAGLGLEPELPDAAKYCAVEDTHGHTQYQWDAALLFIFVMLPVMDLWFSRLSYTANVAVHDAAHKVYDLAQGLIVVVLASSLTTPRALSQMSDATFTIAGCLLAFQASMFIKWFEAWYFNHHRNEHGRLALFHMGLAALTMAPIVVSFGTIATSQDLLWTTLLWFASWLLPMVVQLHGVYVKPAGRYVEVADTLVGFVEKRMMDYMLLLLGECVMQIMRSRSDDQVDYVSAMIAFMCVSSMRQLCFKLCFHDLKIKADHRSVTSLADRAVRMLTAPATVSVAGAMKSLLMDGDVSNKEVAWMLCGASAATAMCFVVTLELVGTVYTDLVRGMTLSLAFLCWAPIPNTNLAGLLGLVLLVWVLLTGVSKLERSKKSTPVVSKPGKLKRQKGQSRWEPPSPPQRPLASRDVQLV